MPNTDFQNYEITAYGIGVKHKIQTCFSKF